MQHDGFASDSVRMVTAIRKEARNIQVLLFSATFNDDIKRFAVKFAGEDANQVQHDSILTLPVTAYS